MKRLIIILMMLLPIAAMAQNDLYKRYASRQELNVAQVSGFKLSESQRVDVVLVVADNEAAWQKLTKELNIKGDDGVVSWLGDPKNPAQRVKWTGTTVLRVVASHARRTVAFYRINTEAQYDALLDYQLNNMKQGK
ncbi:MAG: hypothetical protein J6P54_05795 [Bacteroidales bacterium]|nr:hypothetical protein [Bacteroidales bacterium]